MRPSLLTADGNADRIRDFKNSAQGVAKRKEFTKKRSAWQNTAKQQAKTGRCEAQRRGIGGEPKDKRKFALWAREETLEKVEKLYRTDNVKSRSEFIEKAIGFYCGYLTTESGKEYFPQAIVSVLQGTLGAVGDEKRNKERLQANSVYAGQVAQSGKKRRETDL